MIEAERGAMDQARKLSKNRAMSLFGSGEKANTSAANGGNVSENEAEEEQDQQLLHTGVSLAHIGLEFLAVIALLLIFAILLGDPGISAGGWRGISELLYYSIITGA